MRRAYPNRGLTGSGHPVLVPLRALDYTSCMVAIKKPLPDTRVPQVEEEELLYPASDGLPMSDNMKQWQLMVEVTENLDLMLPDLVAGNNLWYPVEGRPDIRMAPDVYVALGRPKGARSSYLQWKEDNVPLTVVVEVLSPGNSTREMIRKGIFYDRYGAREFIILDPDTDTGWALVREDASGDRREVPDLDGWTSPTLGIRFAYEEGRLRIYRPDGTPFMTFAELAARADEATQRADEAIQRAEREAERARRMAEKLAALGVDPEAL